MSLDQIPQPEVATRRRMRLPCSNRRTESWGHLIFPFWLTPICGPSSTPS